MIAEGDPGSVHICSSVAEVCDFLSVCYFIDHLYLPSIDTRGP